VKPAARLALGGLPGVVLAVMSIAGWPPAGRDLPSYFVPLRERTAEVLKGARGPYWDPDVGCGEPFFANPQSVLLYPPAWLATVLPPATAVGVEAGLHLALLGVGCALLARRLGAGRWLEVAAGWAVIAAGPIVDAVGVLNNLEALAWMPWVWWAALEGRLALVAAFTAACYLAAEPQLAAIAGVMAFALSPRRRTVAALGLAVGLVAVQLFPFASWVRGGDRGHGHEPAEAMAGVVLPGELTSMAVAGAPLPERVGARFVAHFTVPLWALVLGLVAVCDRRPAVRTLAIASGALVVLSVVPWFPWGLKLWNALTLGLVRYPGRLLFPAILAMVPAAAAAIGGRRVAPWAAGAFAVVAGLVGVGVGGVPWAVALESVSVGAVLASVLAAPAALLGVAAVVPLSIAALEMGPTRSLPRPLCEEPQRGAGRIYVVAPSWSQLSWIERDQLRRFVSLGWGYTALLDGRRMVRTFAPLEARALEAHLAEADRGPAGRWWLDALGANRVVSQHPVAGFPVLCEDRGLTVFENPHAWPDVSVVCAVPRPEEVPQSCGEVLLSEGRDGVRRWRVRVAAGGGVLLWLETPDPGWRVQVDGRPAETVRGAGILHGVVVPSGDHEVAARYRPPGLVGGALLSLVSLCVLGVVAWRRW
jgi:hypothetical protein